MSRPGTTNKVDGLSRVVRQPLRITSKTPHSKTEDDTTGMLSHVTVQACDSGEACAMVVNGSMISRTQPRDQLLLWVCAEVVDADQQH